MKRKKFTLIDFPITSVTYSETDNNIFVTLRSKIRNHLIVQYSSGLIGMKGKKKKTPLAGELLGKKIGADIVLKANRLLGIKFKGGRFTPGLHGFLRGLKSHKLDLFFLEDLMSMAHNGVRKRRPKRK